jgi:hypothetical protein
MSTFVGDSGAGQLEPMWVDIDHGGEEVNGNNNQCLLIVVDQVLGIFQHVSRIWSKIKFISMKVIRSS